MNDSYETKAAVLAAKENSDLPIIVTNAYGENGRLMTGADPAVMCYMMYRQNMSFSRFLSASCHG